MSREILRFATFEIVYVVIGTIYALCLYKLNRFLVESGIAENYMDVILYKKGISIYFFIIAVILTGIGSWRAVKRVRCILQDDLDIMEIVVSIIIILALVALIITIIILINNPIFKAVLVVGTIGYIYSGIKA